MKTKQELKQALVWILEIANLNRDTANTNFEENQWKKVSEIAYEALDKPTVVQIERIKRNTK